MRLRVKGREREGEYGFLFSFPGRVAGGMSNEGMLLSWDACAWLRSTGSREEETVLPVGEYLQRFAHRASHQPEGLTNLSL